MSITGEVIPEGCAVRRANQLHAILPVSVVVRLTVAPVGVSDRRTIDPVIACDHTSNDLYNNR